MTYTDLQVSNLITERFPTVPTTEVQMAFYRSGIVPTISGCYQIYTQDDVEALLRALEAL